jgi:hypothetical protein
MCLECGLDPGIETCLGNEGNCYETFRDRMQTFESSLEIRKTGNMGYGIFLSPTAAPIPDGTFIGEYIGLLRPLEASASRYMFPYGRQTYPGDEFKEGVEYRPLCYCDSAEVGNWTRFVNHRCEPNVASFGMCVGGRYMIAFRTIRELIPGEQLFIDYGVGYFWGRKMKCLCDVYAAPHFPEDSFHEENVR